MSFARKFFNVWLRLTEKRHLSRVTTPEALRRSFEFKAKLAFHPPRGTTTRDDVLSGVPVTWVNEANDAGPLILYLHGGAYVMGSRRSYRALSGQISKKNFY